MNRLLPPLCRDRQGVSLVEIMVSLTLFGVAVLSLTAAAMVSSRNLEAGQSYQNSSIAAGSKLDSLRSLGWADLAGESGSDTVMGYPMTWSVSGDNPRVVLLKVVMGQITEGIKKVPTLTTVSLAAIDADVTETKQLPVESGVDLHVTLVSR